MSNDILMMCRIAEEIFLPFVDPNELQCDKLLSQSYWAAPHDFNTFPTPEYVMQPRKGEKEGKEREGETNKIPHKDPHKWDKAAAAAACKAFQHGFFLIGT